MSTHATLDATAFLAAMSGTALPSDADPHGLLLDSHSLGIKHGFNDGDTPDPVLHMARDYYNDPHFFVDSTAWHPTLMDLVQTYLLPSLGNPDTDLYTLSTCHNPIRSTRPIPNTFPHGTVYVPWYHVLAHLVAHLNHTPSPR